MNSSTAWSQSLLDEPMVAQSGDNDFSQFLDLNVDFPEFENLQDGQQELDTPMGDLGMDQLGMGNTAAESVAREGFHNNVASRPASVVHGYMKTSEPIVIGPESQQNSHHYAQAYHHQGYHPNVMVPLTPQSAEMQGAAMRYPQHMDVHGAMQYDRGQMSFTPLVSPAVTPMDSSFRMADYAVPGEYFSPLTSPALDAQNIRRHQPYYPSAPSSETGATSSPIDLNAETAAATSQPQPAVRKSQRKQSTSGRPTTRSVRQSPAMKPQTRGKKKALSMGGTIVQQPQDGDATGKSNGLKPSIFDKRLIGSSDGSGQDSVSPEPLSLMPPPAIPGKSPNLLAQPQSRSGSNDGAATPATLMRLDSGQQQHSPTMGRDGTASGEIGEYMEDIMLPEAMASARPTLEIDTTKANTEELHTPTMSVKTPKLSAGSTPRTSQSQCEPKSSNRTKKRQSTSSTQSPALVPRISPSIKPLMPSSGAGTPVISADASALYLASKSNYQNILEGTHLPGVSYPETLAENLSSKRTSHKLAEQGRRNRINTALREIEALLPPTPSLLGKKERTSSNDGEDGDKSSLGGQSNSKASTVELAIVYIRALQKELEDTKAKLEVAEKKLAESTSSSSQTSD